MSESTKNFESESECSLTGNCKQNVPFVLIDSGDVGNFVPTSNCRQSASYVSALLPNGINTEGRPIVGIDWGRGAIDIYEKGKSVVQFSSLAAAAPHYVGYIWAIESTADSYELQNRQMDLDAIKAADIRAYCSNPKYTAKYRIQWDDIAKTNEADAEVLYRIFTETKITWSILKPLLKEDELRKTINHDIIMDRYLYDGAKAIEMAIRYLPPFVDIPEQFKTFIYESESIKAKKPRNPKPRKQIGRLFMAMARIREVNRGWRTLRRQIGNYGQGYGNILRSEYYHWLVSIAFKARVKKLGIQKTIKSSHIDPKTKKEKQIYILSPQEEQIKKEVMREMQQVLKWLWKLTAFKA